MANNKLNNLYDHLFECIERLKDPEPENRLDLETARRINDLAKTIIDGARIESTVLTKLPDEYRGHLINFDNNQKQLK